MRKIIINYTTLKGKDVRMELYRDTDITREIIYSILYLHTRGLVHLENALPILEVYDGRKQ